MATLFTYSFTGTNGAPFDSAKFTNGNMPAGGSATIQNNRGQLATGTSGSGTAQINQRVKLPAETSDPTVSKIADASVVFSFVYDATQPDPSWIFRGASPVLDGGSGVIIKPSRASGALIVEYSTNYDWVPVATVPKSFVSGTLYKCRAEVFGTAIRVRVWDANGSEPSSWDVQTSVPGVPTAAGYCGFSVATQYGSASSQTWLVDDITITDTAVGTANTAPTANAGADAALVVGQTFTRTGTGTPSGSATIANYGWTITAAPAGSTATIQRAGTASPSFTPDMPGTYTLRLTVTDSLSATGTDDVTLTVTNATKYRKANGTWGLRARRVWTGNAWV